MPRPDKGKRRTSSRSHPPERVGRSPTEIDKRVGRNIRDIRLSRELTLADLAEGMGVSHQQLQKYETGANRLSAGTLCHAARILDVEILRLFEGAADHLEPARKSREAELREEAAFWLTRIRSQSTLQMAVRVLKAIAGPTG